MVGVHAYMLAQLLLVLVFRLFTDIAVGSTENGVNHPQSRTRALRSVVPNSSDNDESIVDEPGEVEHLSSTRRVLKEVSIPIMGRSKPAPTRGRPIRSKSQVTAEESSNGSPSIENSDYDTPRTSISTTPAGSIRHGKPSTHKNGLGKALTTSFSRSSSLKRSHKAVLDSEEDQDTIDADVELALYMQMEEDHAHQIKRLKLELEDDSLRLPEYDAPTTSKATGRYISARDKGKAKLEPMDLIDGGDDDDVDSLLEELATPKYKGKGKGKAGVDEPIHSRTRSARASTKASSFKEEDFLGMDDSDGEDFVVDDTTSVVSDVLSDIDTPMVSDSEEEPLLLASARLKKTTAKAGRSSQPRRGKKKLTAAEATENHKRRQRWAHIEDKWERKRAMNRERAEQQHPKLLSMWKDLAQIPTLEVKQAEQPKSISRRLKPFQLEGLSWMIRQEKTHYKGGLLGDEMGMGKTIQAVSLIMSDYPAKEPTLVCVPPVALMQWSNEIREYTDNKLKVLVYHGTNAKCKKMSIKELKSYDVIMVSYNSLESLHRKETKGWSRGEDIIKEASPLHAIQYHRLILDEAHSIKSRNTGVAKACFALQGKYKWCLSGTPVQNRIGEFFSLLRFLEVRPFADYFCRSCNCEKLHWAVDDDHMCVACNHGASEHISVFNQELLNPITGDDPELREDALAKLHMITARIMLRRMKRDHTNSMVSMYRLIHVHQVNLIRNFP